MLLEFRGQALRVFFRGLAEDIGTLEIATGRTQEENSFARTHGGGAEDHSDAGVMRGLQKYFRSRGLGKKHGAIVLIDSLGRETGAGLLPFDDLGVDGFQALVFQALGRRAGGGQDSTARK